MIIKKIAYKVSLLLLILLFYTVSAQASFSVSKQLIEVEIDRGGEYTGTIIVENNSKEERRIQIKPVDYIQDKEGNVKTPAVGENEFSLYPYLDLSATTLKIKAGGQKKLHYTINLPKEVKGSRWGALYFEEKTKPRTSPKSKNREGRNVSINLKIRYRTLILATANGTEEFAGEVTHFARKKKDRLSFTLDFKNTGNAYYRASGKVDIRNSDGKTVMNMPIKEFFVFPKQKKRITIQKEIKEKLEPGEYAALAIIDYGGDKLVAGQLSFEIGEN